MTASAATRCLSVWTADPAEVEDGPIDVLESLSHGVRQEDQRQAPGAIVTRGPPRAPHVDRVGAGADQER